MPFMAEGQNRHLMVLQLIKIIWKSKQNGCEKELNKLHLIQTQTF
jgi:hypothetical protein